MRQHENNIFLQNFSEALKRARGERSQAEMARLLGIPNQQTYQRYEKGINEPLASAAHAICSKLGVDFTRLLTGRDQPYKVAEAPGEYKATAPPASSRAEFPRVQDAIDFIANQLGVDKVKVLEAIMAAVRESAMNGKT